MVCIHTGTEWICWVEVERELMGNLKETPSDIRFQFLCQTTTGLFFLFLLFLYFISVQNLTYTYFNFSDSMYEEKYFFKPHTGLFNQIPIAVTSFSGAFLFVLTGPTCHVGGICAPKPKAGNILSLHRRNTHQLISDRYILSIQCKPFQPQLA